MWELKNNGISAADQWFFAFRGFTVDPRASGIEQPQTGDISQDNLGLYPPPDCQGDEDPHSPQEGGLSMPACCRGLSLPLALMG